MKRSFSFVETLQNSRKPISSFEDVEVPVNVRLNIPLALRIEDRTVLFFFHGNIINETRFAEGFNRLQLERVKGVR